jgi:hypothetical protein
MGMGAGAVLGAGASAADNWPMLTINPTSRKPEALFMNDLSFRI